jgi:outer membrane protein, protease secretion system
MTRTVQLCAGPRGPAHLCQVRKSESRGPDPRRRVRTLTRLLAAAGLMAQVASAQAMTLAEAFEAARIHDPQYRAASHELDAARQGVPIARSALLPQVSFSYSNANVAGTRDFPNGSQQEVTARVEYMSPQTTLSMRAPLFNYEAWSRLDQARAQGVGAEANYRARGLDLVDRVTAAYLDALAGQALLSLTQAEVEAMQQQFNRAEQRFKRGEGTRIDEANARASLEVARSRVADAQDRVSLAASRLKRLTGRMPDFLLDTGDTYLPPRVSSESINDAVSVALAHNPVIEVRQAAVESARFAVRRNQAGHLPRLDLVANISQSRNESLSNLNQGSSLRTVGVQLQIPLFNGGGVQASVMQAQAELARTEEELRNERENTEVEVMRHFQTADNAALRAEALHNAMVAGELALFGATRAEQAGLGTQSEVLTARSQLFSVRRDLAQARYDYLAARMRLMALTGDPMQRVIDQIDAALVRRSDLPMAEPQSKAR